MAERQQQERIRRIVVAIDASRHSLAGLEAAVDLALQLNADLTGLFIEDINLLRLGEMPISNQLGRYSLTRQRLSLAEIRRQLLTQGRWAYEALELLSTRRGLRWAFRVARGPIFAELLRAAEEADLVILGKAGWSDTRLVGSTTQAFLAQPGRLTLILREGVHLGKSVMLIFDGTAASWRALEAARLLSTPEDRRLVVMVVAENREAAGGVEREIQAWNEDKGFELVFLWTPDANTLIVCGIARTEESGLLVIPQERRLFSDEALARVLNDIDCPVLFVGRAN